MAHRLVPHAALFTAVDGVVGGPSATTTAISSHEYAFLSGSTAKLNYARKKRRIGRLERLGAACDLADVLIRPLVEARSPFPRYDPCQLVWKRFSVQHSIELDREANTLGDQLISSRLLEVDDAELPTAFAELCGDPQAAVERRQLFIARKMTAAEVAKRQKGCPPCFDNRRASDTTPGRVRHPTRGECSVLTLSRLVLCSPFSSLNPPYEPHTNRHIWRPSSLYELVHPPSQYPGIPVVRRW